MAAEKVQRAFRRLHSQQLCVPLRSFRRFGAGAGAESSNEGSRVIDAVLSMVWSRDRALSEPGERRLGNGGGGSFDRRFDGDLSRH